MVSLISSLVAGNEQAVTDGLSALLGCGIILCCCYYNCKVKPYIKETTLIKPIDINVQP